MFETFNVPAMYVAIQGQHCLDGHIHGWHVEGLEHDLCHALTIGLGVQWRLGEQNWVLLWGNTELVVERMMPNFLHVVPVGHDAVLDGVLERQHTTLALCLVTDIAVLLVHADHDARHLGAANDRREHSTRCIVASEASLAHSTAIVHHQRRHFLVVSHGCLGLSDWPYVGGIAPGGGQWQ